MRFLTAAMLDGYQRRKDRTVSVRFVTQEQGSDKIMDIDSMLDSYGFLYFRPEEQLREDEIEELDNLDMDIYDNRKTQSQRLRAVLYKVWEQGAGEKHIDPYLDFKTFYKQETEKIIQHYKNKLTDGL